MTNGNTLDNGTTGGNVQDGPLQPQPQPSVCPGCGRCRQCGQPSFQPYRPYPHWQVDDPYPYPFTTWTTCATT